VESLETDYDFTTETEGIFFDSEADHYYDDYESYEDFSSQKINESKIAGLLQGLLNDNKVNYLTISSESERGNLQNIDSETFKELVVLVELEVSHHKVKIIDKKAFEQNVDLAKIDFSDNEITDLDPELFENLLQLREVNFQQNRLKDLPVKLFEKNVDVLVIKFDRNEIQKVPKQLFDKLENLEEIYLNENRIKIISDRFYKKTNIKNVQLNNNEIEKITVKKVAKKIDFKNQLKINLSNNKLESLPPNAFKGMGTIQILKLSNNTIKNLNSNSFLNSSIETIDFSNNKIVEIPRDFPDNFKEIILNGNPIRKIHDSLYKNKKNLENLELRENQIDEIFVSEGTTENLDEEKDDLDLIIYLSANKLKELKPHTFGSIKSKLRLDLSENSLKFLPENLFDGSKVGDLNFANNLIEKLESNTFENAQLAVDRADFSNNKIKLLDEKLFENWKSLYDLDLSHNQIKVLPENLLDGSNVGNLNFANNLIEKLESNTFGNSRFDVSGADFSNNKIKLLDEKLFENWKSLYDLDLSHNQIKVLPEKLFGNELKNNLKTVSFADNQISKIGYNTFFNCSDLRIIDLRNNTCFDLAFYGNRKQDEICSANCKESCFLVNGYEKKDLTLTRRPTKPGVFYGRQACKKSQCVINGNCHYVRMPNC
jgi:Leucine-rich repeat (LRR) protein